MLPVITLNTCTWVTDAVCLFALRYFAPHVETEGDVLFSLSWQCKQTCLRRRDICCTQVSSAPTQTIPKRIPYMTIHSFNIAFYPHGLAQRVPRALAQELLENSYKNRKLAWVRNDYNTRNHSLHQHQTLPKHKNRLLYVSVTQKLGLPASLGKRGAAVEGLH